MHQRVNRSDENLSQVTTGHSGLVNGPWNKTKNSQKAETFDSINIWLFNQERRENGFALANQDRKKEFSVQIYFF